jgi:ubiquitin-conjugating enzyme E2 G1
MASGQQKITGSGMLLAKQLKLMQTTDHIPGISVGLVDDKDVFEWEVMLMINDECKFYGGML